MSIKETQGDGRPVNKPGVYRREDGSEIVTTKDPIFGSIQGDAIVQQGYKWAGDHSLAEKSQKPSVETPKK